MPVSPACNLFVTYNSDLCIVKPKLLIHMKKTWIAAFAFGCLALQGTAQEVSNEKKGDAIITVFSNLHSGLGKDNDDRGFAIERAYIGYRYQLPGNVTLQAVADVGKSKDVGDYNYLAYLKNAFVQWKHQKLTLTGGMISTTQFNLQEKSWGKRYVMKSFQDEYGFGSSADLGVSAAYDFTSKLSADVIVVNGEGYKKIQNGDGLLYGAGLTARPLTGLTVRVYGGFNEASKNQESNMVNAAAFIGYKHTDFNLGVEYNYQTNASYTDGHDQQGVSAFAAARIARNVEVYGRWDYLNSKSGWNASEGNAGLLGADFKLGKYVKLSPNVRIKAPKADDASNSYYAYLNCSFAL